eukprot:CAMPEP_0174704568 /NCGR_PEP_ID=MMETSP1094-20130205/8111_1 /TAXON_ID=156173 /ORGANISM="Chrysochromulina brevifilum, Strain UTEX LB 985" /LENGTH=100 /DNA_ID=CAMNT_0015902635 /DNA_START=154 /DNA_END=454 /DNA_ORIENTATION=-
MRCGVCVLDWRAELTAESGSEGALHECDVESRGLVCSGPCAVILWLEALVQALSVMAKGSDLSGAGRGMRVPHARCGADDMLQGRDQFEHSSGWSARACW